LKFAFHRLNAKLRQGHQKTKIGYKKLSKKSIVLLSMDAFSAENGK